MNQPEIYERLGALLCRYSPCHFAIIDRDHRIVFVNDAFREIFGDRISAHCYDVYKGRQQPCPTCPAAAARIHGWAPDANHEGRDQRDRYVAYRVRAVAIPNAVGDSEHVLLLGTDETHAREMEDRLQQTEPLALVGMNAAGMAHTIKNLIGGLEGGAYMLDSGIERTDFERLKAGWEMVQGYIERATVLVKSLLEYAKPSAHSPELTDIRALVLDVAKLYRPRALATGCELVTEVGAGVGYFFLDPKSTHATLTNLVANAVDACMWDPDTDKEHEIRVSAHGDTEGALIFEVLDNGPGISEEIQPKIFRAVATSKGLRGTGLGLLLCKQAVADHQGSIDVQTTPRQGTTFRIKLPAPPSAELQEATDDEKKDSRSR